MSETSLRLRNAETARQFVAEFTEKVLAQQVRIDGLLNTVSGLIERVQSLEQQAALRKIEQIGHGPTKPL
jgi:hypothetical protein